MYMTLPESYEDYVKERKGTLKRTKYNQVIKAMSERIIHHLIDGSAVFLPGGFGFLQIVESRKTYKRAAVDWEASNKYKAELLAEGKKLYDHETGEGHEWLIFHTDPTYLNVFWSKKASKLRNKNIYSFTPHRNAKGLRTRMLKAAREDPLVALKYEPHEKALRKVQK